MPDEESPLWIASHYGRTFVVELLIAAGANVDFHDSRGRSCLDAAIRHNHQSIVDRLIQAGAFRGAGAANWDEEDEEEEERACSLHSGHVCPNASGLISSAAQTSAPRRRRNCLTLPGALAGYPLFS